MNILDWKDPSSRQGNNGNNGNISFDNYFSYWIFLWAVLYIITYWSFKEGYLKYSPVSFFIQNCNPFIVVFIAFIFNVISLLLLSFTYKRFIILILYIFVIIIIKVIPLYFLRKMPINIIPNMVSIITLLIIYCIYLASNGHNIFEFYQKEMYNISRGNTPFIRIFLDVYDNTPLFHDVK